MDNQVLITQDVDYYRRRFAEESTVELVVRFNRMVEECWNCSHGAYRQALGQELQRRDPEGLAPLWGTNRLSFSRQLRVQDDRIVVV